MERTLGLLFAALIGTGSAAAAPALGAAAEDALLGDGHRGGHAWS